MYLNGKYFSQKDPLIQGTDRGLLLADGLFETVLVQHGRAVLMQEHWARLQHSATALDIPFHITANELSAIIQTLVEREANGEAVCSARITLTRGPGVRGLGSPAATQLKPSLLISVTPVYATPPTQMRVMIGDIRRNCSAPSAQMKTLGYLDNILARKQAVASGADEALLLNNQGHLACAAAANIFLIEAGIGLSTPALMCGVLPGVVRAQVIASAHVAGVPVREGVILPGQLRHCPAFLTNSLIGLVPIVGVAGEVAPMVGPARELFLDLADRYAQKIKPH